MSTAMLSWIASTYVAAERGGSSMGVLVNYGLRVDHAGRVEMSHAEVGRRINRSARQVQRHVHQLAADGWLAYTEQWDKRTGAQIANIVRMLAPWVLRMIEGEANAPDQPPLAADAAPPPPATPPAPPPATPPPVEPPPLGRSLSRRLFRFPDGGIGCYHQRPPCEECALPVNGG